MKQIKKIMNQKHIANGKMNTIMNFIILWKYINIFLSKKIVEMFYTNNVHPMLNTQKIHDQLKRL
jgi:hypothetical protein